MRLAIIILLAAVCLPASWAQSDGFKRKGTGPERLAKNALEGKAPPQLQVGTWLNSQKEITLKSLHGKVIVVDFWSLT